MGMHVSLVDQTGHPLTLNLSLEGEGERGAR
jgi:hypothetical protein